MPFVIWTRVGPRKQVGCTLATPGEYHWTVHVRRRCGLLSNYSDHLLRISITFIIMGNKDDGDGDRCSVDMVDCLRDLCLRAILRFSAVCTVQSAFNNMVRSNTLTNSVGNKKRHPQPPSSLPIHGGPKQPAVDAASRPLFYRVRIAQPFRTWHCYSLIYLSICPCPVTGIVSKHLAIVPVFQPDSKLYGFCFFGTKIWNGFRKSPH